MDFSPTVNLSPAQPADPLATTGKLCNEHINATLYQKTGYLLYLPTCFQLPCTTHFKIYSQPQHMVHLLQSFRRGFKGQMDQQDHVRPSSIEMDKQNITSQAKHNRTSPVVSGSLGVGMDWENRGSCISQTPNRHRLSHLMSWVVVHLVLDAVQLAKAM